MAIHPNTHNPKSTTKATLRPSMGKGSTGGGTNPTISWKNPPTTAGSSTAPKSFSESVTGGGNSKQA